MSKITILTLVDRIACFYSLKPFLDFGHGRFRFTSSADYCLKRDRNRTLIMVRQFIKPDLVDLELLKQLRKKYDRIAYFHDDAGGGIPRLAALPYVDLFYSKALFRDRSLYLKPLYGKELYSDYYHRRYGVMDKDHKERGCAQDEAELKKLRLSWNIGVGDYPRELVRQRFGTAAALIMGPLAARPFHSSKPFPIDPIGSNRGLYPVHARIGLTSRPSIAYQRKLILDRIGSDQRFLLGEVSQAQYNKEIAHSRIVLSPFGWGELCLRDFEAVRAGALLMKPDMGHLETWPDIFIPNETYAPIAWDARDLITQTDRYLTDEQERRRLATAAWDCYQSQLSQLEERFESILGEIRK